MSPTPPDDLLSAFLDGELSAEERAQVERLLSESPDDRQTLEEFRALSGELKGLARHKLDEGFAERVLRQAERQMLEAPASVAASSQPSGDSLRDGRPTPPPRGPRPNAERLDDVPAWPRRLIRPAAYALLTLAAALLLMFFFDADDPLPVAQNEVRDRGADPTGSAGELAASSAPSEPPQISALRVEKSAGDAERPLPRALDRTASGAAHFAGGGGGGMGGMQDVGASSPDDLVVHVAVASEGADLAAIERLFDDNAVTVVEDDLVAKVSAKLMRKLVEAFVEVEEDKVVELEQLNAAPEAGLERLEGLGTDRSSSPEEVAYLVEATPEQIERIVAAIDASSAEGQPAARFRLLKEPATDVPQRRGRDALSETLWQAAASAENAADDEDPEGEGSLPATEGELPAAPAQREVGAAIDPAAGARGAAQTARARRYALPPTDFETPPSPSPTDPEPTDSEPTAEEAPPAPAEADTDEGLEGEMPSGAEYAEEVTREDVPRAVEMLRESADENRRDQGKHFAEGESVARRRLVRVWFVFRVAPPELAAPEDASLEPLPAAPDGETLPEPASEPANP